MDHSILHTEPGVMAVIPDGMEVLLEMKATDHLCYRLLDHWVWPDASIHFSSL